MKTTDLIPILLYHLKSGDKYGLELINECSNCSNGKIIIKQPTLYSILKKLEKSKFITSYWQDSAIGGKRHYFKITENGLSQLETYPPLEDLIKMAIEDDFNDEMVEKEEKKLPKEENNASPNPFDNFSVKKEENNTNDSINVFDKLFIKEDQKQEKPEQIVETEEEMVKNNATNEEIINIEPTIEETIFKVEEKNDDLNISSIDENISAQTSSSTSFSVFDALDFADNTEEETTPPTQPSLELENPFYKETKEKTLEEKSNLEINEENTKLFTKDSKKDEFLSNDKVSKFTQKPVSPTEQSRKETVNLFKEETKTIIPIKFEVEENIKFQDYINIKNDEKVKKVLRRANIKLTKILLSSIVCLMSIFACFLISLKYNISAIFTVFAVSSTLYIVYYSCNFIGKFKEHKYSIGESFLYDFKKSFIVRIIIFSSLVLFVLIYNLIQKSSLFAIENFANFLAPVIISSLILVDYVIALIFYRHK